MSTLRVRSSSALLTVIALAATPLILAAPLATAAPGGRGTDKVRICHRTNALINPYVSIEVASSSVDGDGGNDSGQGDHYLNHVGPVWTSTTVRGADWGDIIPPIPGVHDGRNWTPDGEAIWSAGCRPANVTDTDGDRIPDVVDPDSDGDKVPDVTDTDDDGDSIPDTGDPDESSTTDTDGDSVPDRLDSDDDGDGLPDNTECEPKSDSTSDTTTPPADTSTSGAAPTDTTTQTTPATDATASTDATGASEPTSTSGNPSNNANTGNGQDINGAGAPRMRTAGCDAGGNALPPVDDGGDIDGDGTVDSKDKDDDADGVPDTQDNDADGDTLPAKTDPDDDGDRIPDVLDPDKPPVQSSDVVDTDADGTPDSRDRDGDGDGVRDVRDSDADGNGQAETRDQVIATSVALPATIEPGTPTLLWRDQPTTKIGMPLAARIACAPAGRSAVKSALAGDIGTADLTRSLCDVKQTRVRATVTVVSGLPTVVTVRLTAPAVGAYRAADRTLTYLVTP